MRISTKLKKILALPWSIYFNFHYLPWSQAKKLPIILTKPHLKTCRGEIRINGPITTGMIQLGVHSVTIFPDKGIIYENRGGKIIFNGPCTIGSNSAISIGEKGKIVFGEDIVANSSIKIVCYHDMVIESHCRIGWNCLLMDTDFHALTVDSNKKCRGYGPVKIGHNCWLGTGVTILKNCQLPAYTTVQAYTIVSKKMNIPERSVIGMDSTPVVKATNIYRNLDDDTIEYNK